MRSQAFFSKIWCYLMGWGRVGTQHGLTCFWVQKFIFWGSGGHKIWVLLGGFIPRRDTVGAYSTLKTAEFKKNKRASKFKTYKNVGGNFLSHVYVGIYLISLPTKYEENSRTLLISVPSVQPVPSNSALRASLCRCWVAGPRRNNVSMGYI